MVVWLIFERFFLKKTPMIQDVFIYNRFLRWGLLNLVLQYQRFQWFPCTNMTNQMWQTNIAACHTNFGWYVIGAWHRLVPPFGQNNLKHDSS